MIMILVAYVLLKFTCGMKKITIVGWENLNSNLKFFFKRLFGIAPKNRKQIGIGRCVFLSFSGICGVCAEGFNRVNS